jgi:hypothetical protein
VFCCKILRAMLVGLLGVAQKPECILRAEQYPFALAKLAARINRFSEVIVGRIVDLTGERRVNVNQFALGNNGPAFDETSNVAVCNNTTKKRPTPSKSNKEQPNKWCEDRHEDTITV